MKLSVRTKLLTFILSTIVITTAGLFVFSRKEFTGQIDAYTRENTLVPIRSSRPYLLVLLGKAMGDLVRLGQIPAEQLNQQLPNFLLSNEHAIVFGTSDLGFENPNFVFREDFFSIFSTEPKKYVETALIKIHEKVPKINSEEYEIINISQEDFFSAALIYRAQTKLYYSFIRFDKLLDDLKGFEKNPVILLSKEGKIVFHTNRNKMVGADSMASLELFQKALDPNSASITSFDFLHNQTLMTGSYAKLNVLGLVLVSFLAKGEAYAPIYRYVRILGLSGIIIILISVVFAIFFGNAITNPLVDMTTATQEIRKGNYGVTVDAYTNDELRDLAEGFNLMSSEITKLMQETAEKAILDKELETASAVQNTLIPSESYQDERLQIGGKYYPAAQCGGDWWSYFLLDDGRVILLIADATGHGVSSALVTAAASSAVSTISYIAKREKLALTSDVILEEINSAIYKASKGQIFMTFFVAAIDPQNREITYSNASHNVPYLVRKGLVEKEGKKSIKPLIGANGDICGLKPESTYQLDKVAYEPGDTLILYTDGLIECENAGKEEYGKKRLFRVLLKNADCDAVTLSTKIIEDAEGFYSGHEHKDDISLVVTKFL